MNNLLTEKFTTVSDSATVVCCDEAVKLCSKSKSFSQKF